MPAQAIYRIDIKNTSGVKVAEISNYRSLRYVKRRNEAGELVFSLDDNSPVIPLLEENAIVEVWRKNSYRGLPWYCDFRAIYRAEERETERRSIFTATCPGIISRLGDRIVAYPKDTVNRSYFTLKYAESIIKLLSTYNFTSAATVADGRIRDGLFSSPPYITVETDLERGPLIVDWECAEQNVLQVMQELCQQYKVAFDLYPVSANTFELRYVENIDVSNSQIFSIDRGNVSRINYRKNRINEGTVAIVGGQGEDLDKVYAIVNGGTYSSSNDRELYVNGSSEELVAGLNFVGAKELSAQQARPEIEFSVLQTPGSYYGLHYDLHYQVTGRYKNTNYLLVVSEIAIDFSSGNEQIDVTLTDI